MIFELKVKEHWFKLQPLASLDIYVLRQIASVLGFRSLLLEMMALAKTVFRAPTSMIPWQLHFYEAGDKQEDLNLIYDSKSEKRTSFYTEYNHEKLST